jgi:hypothetical protein
VIHCEFENLPHDRYLFVCMRQDYSSQLIHYAEPVIRRLPL